MATQHSKFYLCIGHPAWPDPLRVETFTEAVEWFRSHVDQHPEIRVASVVMRSDDLLYKGKVLPNEKQDS